MLNKENIKKWVRRLIWAYVALTVLSLAFGLLGGLLNSPLGLVVLIALVVFVAVKLWKSGRHKLVIGGGIIVALQLVCILFAAIF